MVPDVTGACGEAVADLARDENALRAAVEEFTREDCSRENINGAAGLLGWSCTFLLTQGEDGAQALAAAQGAAALLVLVGFYSGGLRERGSAELYSRFYFKSENREYKGANAEECGHLDIAEAHYARACELRAQALELLGV